MNERVRKWEHETEFHTSIITRRNVDKWANGSKLKKVNGPTVTIKLPNGKPSIKETSIQPAGIRLRIKYMQEIIEAGLVIPGYESTAAMTIKNLEDQLL